MKVYSDAPVIEQPLEKINYIANHDGFPRNSTAPCLFYHNTLERLFINITKTDVEDWQMIPYGTINQSLGYKSLVNIQLLEGKKIPFTMGGTYLIDSDGKKDQKYSLPPITLVSGIIYNIKNIGENIIHIVTETSETIDGNHNLVIHPKQCTTLQPFDTDWVILNTYHPSQL
jgi:hypothetical protein